MIIVAVLIVLLVIQSSLLLYTLFTKGGDSKDIIAQITGSLTVVMFWVSEYCSQSQCKPNGIIDILKFLLGKLEKETNGEERKIIEVGVQPD